METVESQTNNMGMFIGEYIRNAEGCLRKVLVAVISRYNKVFKHFFFLYGERFYATHPRSMVD
jgi:hypothetical protein